MVKKYFGNFYGPNIVVLIVNYYNNYSKMQLFLLRAVQFFLHWQNIALWLYNKKISLLKWLLFTLFHIQTYSRRCGLSCQTSGCLSVWRHYSVFGATSTTDDCILRIYWKPTLLQMVAWRKLPTIIGHSV